MLRHRREYSILTPSVRPVTVTPAQAVRCHDSQEVRNTDSGTNVYAVSRDQGLLVAPQCRRPEPCPDPRLVAFSSLFIARSCHVGSGRAAAPGATVCHGSDRGETYSGKDAHCQTLASRLQTQLATQQVRELTTQHLDDSSWILLCNDKFEVNEALLTLECCTVLS